MQINTIRTITELSQSDGRVYVHLPTREIADRFMRQAASEGFTFKDGVKPTARSATQVMAVNYNHTINFVGAIGHIAFESGAKTVGGQSLLRMVYTGSIFVPHISHTYEK